MADFPRSLIEFQRRFPDEGACAAYLADRTLRKTAGSSRLRKKGSILMS
jgi:hypothetical protein